MILTEKGKVKDTRKWIYRYSPERNLFELGVFGGLFLAADDHDLYDPATRPVNPHTPAEALYKVVGDFGARIAYFPLSFLGIEGEFAAIPTRVRDAPDPKAFVYSARAHAILQLPYRVAPFVLGGYGALGVISDKKALGNDVDGVGHAAENGDDREDLGRPEMPLAAPQGRRAEGDPPVSLFEERHVPFRDKRSQHQ